MSEVGRRLTDAEADEQVRRSTLTGRDRYRVHPTSDGWRVWDHEDAVTVADRDGRTTFDRHEDARDLAMEHIG